MKQNLNLLRLKQMTIRLITAISIFTLTVFFTPNFNIQSFPLLILSSFFIICIDYLISVITNIHDLSLGRGVVGFTAAIIFIYVSQFFIAGYSITLISSFIAATIYGIIASLIPNKI